MSATECFEDSEEEAVTPVPDKTMLGELEALLAMASPPVTDPAAFGSNVTVTVVDWFGARVTPDPPLAVKPLPEADTLEISRFALPVFWRITGNDEGVPTVMLPKVRWAVFAEICGADATPVPDKATL